MVGQSRAANEADRQPAPGVAGPHLAAMVSARDAARILGVHEKTIRRAIRRGELAAVKRGRSFESALDEQDRYRRRAGQSSPPERLPANVLPFPSLDRGARHHLPVALTRFIGREREVEDISALLARPDVRLVTLHGPGGVGKTRLSLQVAEEMEGQFRDGVAFVPLAAVRRVESVLPTMLQALEVRGQESSPARDQLVTWLAGRDMLLVIDNVEQVLAAAPTLVDLLMQAPRVKALVTSRAPMRVAGEQIYAVPPLPLPPEPAERATAREAGWEELAGNEAVQLFVDRAQAADGHFRLTPDNAAAIAAICRRTDGLPLALELAAARIRLLTPAALLTQLSMRLPVLADGPRDQPDRLRTMRDAIAWSHDILSEDEQRLFRRLAVFVGGFSFDAAEAIVAAESELTPVLDVLTSLVNQSLIQRGPDIETEPRFTMLETIREYGLERLRDQGEMTATRETHAWYFLGQAEAAARDAGGASDSGWMRRLTTERSNLLAALDWLGKAGHADAVLQMTGALWHYWYRLGDLAEGRARLERALAAATPAVEPAFRARALRGAGVLAWQSADYERSRARLDAALSAYRALGDQTGVAWVLNSLGCLCATLSSTEQADAYLSEALALFHTRGDAVGVANLTCNLGELAVARGEDDLAVARLEAGLAMWEGLGDRVGAVRAQVYLAQALLAQGEAPRAEATLRDALAAIRTIDYRQLLPVALRTLAQLAMRRGDATTAASWYGAADGAMAALGIQLPAPRRGDHERAVAAVREQLGDERFVAAWATGRADPAGLMSAALANRERAEGEPKQIDEVAFFTSRQRDVLRLLAQGRTDKEIAEALFISRPTASKHVSSILAKLGAPSRTAAVVIAHQHGLF